MDKELNKLDRVATLRPDDLIPLSHEGEEGKNMTVEDFKIAMRLDYSSLDEQVIPGRKLMCTDGVARQAYIRTYTGVTNPDSGGGYYLLDQGTPVSSFALLFGVVMDLQGYLIQSQLVSFGANMDNYWNLGVAHDANGKNILAIVSRGNQITNRPYSITVMYTKA